MATAHTTLAGSDESSRRSDESTRRSDESTRRSDESTGRSDESSRRSDESTRRSDESSRRSDESTRRSDESTRRSDESTGRSDESSRRSDESTRRSDESSRRSDESTRRSDESTGRSDESTGRSDESTRRSDESSGRSDESNGRSDESSRRSDESSRRSDESTRRSDESSGRSVGPVDSWESELTSIQNSLKFVLLLKEEFVCPVCSGVVLNPQQNSCGHIYCYRCLQGLLESSSPSSPVCPVEGAVITPAEVFQDNCCRREISCLEVYCINYPACTCVVTLQRLQEHLSSCQYEQLQCTNPGCRAALQRRHLQEHVTHTCPHRTEPCPHCRQQLQLGRVQDHLHSTCPQVELDCPDSCALKVARHQLAAHREACPEVHVDCSYRRFGCPVQDKRCRVKLHEDAAVNHHMLLVLRSNTHLEQQVEVLQEEALLRQHEVQVDARQLADLQKKIGPLQQQTSSHDHMVSAAQRTLSRHEDILSTAQLDIQQVSQGLGSGLEDLEQLRKSVDAVIQNISATEALKEHLETLEENLRRHSSVLELHAAQLSQNKRHLRELEATSHDGKLIWKIDGFRKRREDEAKGQTPCLTSSPFHTGRCGYKMAAKAYLNGDGEGRGTHLSLYVVLMPGDFDALLPWPFKQNVSLSILDQSGAGNHRTLSFRPDPASKSFQRPAADAFSNVASGLSCFIPVDKLENPPNASYVDDDTLFVKVKVDMSGLEQLLA